MSMARIQRPFTVHEAEVAVWHAWGDGIPVAGPTPRHLNLPVTFRAGLRMAQGEGLETGGDFGEWRGRRAIPGDGEWTVEMSSPLGAAWDAGVQVDSLPPVGAPVVIVVRFFDRAAGLWRVYQFHDAFLAPADAGEDGQRMMRALRFAAGWREEFKSGTMPGLEPRLRGVIEWRHLGRVVRCWEYDPVLDAWQEDAENVVTMEGVPVRYVTLDSSVPGEVSVAMLAAVSQDGEMAGLQAALLGWKDVAVFTVGSSGLTLEPGWTLEAQGAAEPLLLPPSGRHWEHPKVVFRVLGRHHATACAGVFALPALQEGVPERPMDLPLRIGRLLLYPDGGWLVDA